MLQENNILLRKLSLEDAEELARYATNVNIWNNLRDYIPHPYTYEDAVTFISSKITEDPVHTFCINYDNAFCGIIGINPQSDVYSNTAELGYWVAEPFWGKGIASKAVGLISTYVLEDLEFRRVYAGVFSYNQASMRVLEKNDFEKEGVLKGAVTKNNVIYDEHRYGLNAKSTTTP